MSLSFLNSLFSDRRFRTVDRRKIAKNLWISSVRCLLSAATLCSLEDRRTTATSYDPPSPTMVIPESSTNATREPQFGIEDECNHQQTLDADVDVVRRRREKAFLEVGFAEVAEQTAVNGYSSITNPAVDVARPSPIECSSSDKYLRTPLINISNTGNGSVSGDGENPKPNSPQHQHLKANPQFFLAPEAALHRDGEQARLVEVVRRRQIRQRQINGESTYQWLEENVNQFWESVLVYGGLRGDPRNNPTNRGVQSTIPINPYRSNYRQELNNTEIMKTGSTISSASFKTNEQSIDHPFSDQSSSKLRRIIYLLLCNILQVLYAFIDFCIARLAPSEPLRPCGNTAIAPTYNIQISADDILRFWAIQCVFLIYSSWMHVFAFPMVVMMCLTIGSLSRKFRSPSVAKRHQHGSNTAVVSKEMPAKVSTLDISSRPTNSQLRDCAIQNLQTNNPGATSAECSRFFAAVKHNEDAAS